MTLIKCAVGIYRNKSGSLRVVDREWENKGKDSRWLLEWSGFSMPGISQSYQRRFPTMREARAFIRNHLEFAK